MRYRAIGVASALAWIAAMGLSVATVRAEGDVHKVNHVIIIMQENHSFDNMHEIIQQTLGLFG